MLDRHRNSELDRILPTREWTTRSLDDVSRGTRPRVPLRDQKQTTVTAFGLPVTPKLTGRPRVGPAHLPEGRLGSVTQDDTHPQLSDVERFPNFV